MCDFYENFDFSSACLDINRHYNGESGVCPVCDSDFEIIDTIIEFKHNPVTAKWVCRNCNTKGEELSDVVFRHHVVKKDRI